MDGLLLNICRNDWCNISTINLATFGDIWKFLESGIWKSGNLEIPGNWLVLANFNILGIFPTQFRSLTLILNPEFQISNISGIWKLEIWKSGNSRKLTSFGQFQYIGYFSHSVQVTELDFQLRISNFQFFWNLEIGNLEIRKFPEIGQFWPISIYWVFFPLSLGH